MPLIKSGSKKSVGKNIKTEMEHGKPQKQAIAIALSVQRKNKQKKMAQGGVLSAKDEKRPMPENEYNDSKENSRAHSSKMEQLSAANEVRPSHDQEFNDKKSASKVHLRQDGPQAGNWKNDFMRGIDDADTPEEFMMMMSRGGHIPSPDMESMHDIDLPVIDEDDHDMIAELMYRRHMADGGEVDLDLNAEEQPNFYYKRNEDEVLKENYDEDMDDMSQPEDSNEHADERESDEENEHDDVENIRRRMKSRKAR